jgi:glutaredoxin-like protein NrdH
MTITVYSKPGCFECKATKRELDKLNLPYHEIDITQDNHAAQRLREMSSLKLPRVEVESAHFRDSWTGHRPSRIEALVEIS